MDLQTALTAIIVLAATAYLMRTAWRSVNGGCASGCGKCVAPPDLITLKVRRQ